MPSPQAAARPSIETLGGKLHHLVFSCLTMTSLAFWNYGTKETMVPGSLAIALLGAVSGGKTAKCMSSSITMGAVSVAHNAVNIYALAIG